MSASTTLTVCHRRGLIRARLFSPQGCMVVQGLLGKDATGRAQRVWLAFQSCFSGSAQQRPSLLSLRSATCPGTCSKPEFDSWNPLPCALRRGTRTAPTSRELWWRGLQPAFLGSLLPFPEETLPDCNTNVQKPFCGGLLSGPHGPPCSLLSSPTWLCRLFVRPGPLLGHFPFQTVLNGAERRGPFTAGTQKVPHLSR